jgi:hypothetical protein
MLTKRSGGKDLATTLTINSKTKSVIPGTSKWPVLRKTASPSRIFQNGFHVRLIRINPVVVGCPQYGPQKGHCYGKPCSIWTKLPCGLNVWKRTSISSRPGTGVGQALPAGGPSPGFPSLIDPLRLVVNDCLKMTGAPLVGQPSSRVRASTPFASKYDFARDVASSEAR